MKIIKAQKEREDMEEKKLVIIRDGDHSLSRKRDLKKICKELSQIISNHI